MFGTEEALPTAEEAQASTQPESLATEGEQPEKVEATDKPQKTPEQRALEKAQRVIDRRTRQREELRAEVMQLRQQVGLRQQSESDTTADDDKPITLTRKQIDALITEQASRLAPQIKQVEDIEVKRRSTALAMKTELGPEKFDAYTSDLDEAMGGMQDSQGNLKPAVEAIFESETPAALLEYLADPENADEAESLGRMSALKAGRAIAMIEQKIKAEAKTAKEKAKPQPSNAPEPLERVKASGQPSHLPSDSDTPEEWARKERARMEAKRKK